VLRRGTWTGLNADTPIGGHKSPISITGVRLLWKNAQKKEKKNITSEIIKRIIPMRRPFVTTEVWSP
jgi:hypothetical protein